MSQTLAIIKPDAVGSGKAGKILAHLEGAGFSVKGSSTASLASSRISRSHSRGTASSGLYRVTAKLSGT